MSGTKRRRNLTRTQLLPLDRMRVKIMSTINFVAVEMLQSGVAQEFQLKAIEQSIYLVREYSRAGYGTLRPGLYEAALKAFRQCATAENSGLFRADKSACALFSEVAVLLDWQSLRVPRHVFEAADARLETLAAAQSDGR